MRMQNARLQNALAKHERNRKWVKDRLQHWPTLELDEYRLLVERLQNMLIPTIPDFLLPHSKSLNVAAIEGPAGIAVVQAFDDGKYQSLQLYPKNAAAKYLEQIEPRP